MVKLSTHTTVVAFIISPIGARVVAVSQIVELARHNALGETLDGRVEMYGVDVGASTGDELDPRLSVVARP